jgi:hypothetical protein
MEANLIALFIAAILNLNLLVAGRETTRLPAEQHSNPAVCGNVIASMQSRLLEIPIYDLNAMQVKSDLVANNNKGE